MRRLYSLNAKLYRILLLLQIPVLIIFFGSLQFITSSNNSKTLDSVSYTTSAQLSTINAAMADATTTLRLFVIDTPLTSSPDYEIRDSLSWLYYYQDLNTTFSVTESGSQKTIPSYFFIYNHDSDAFLKSSLHSIPSDEVSLLYDYLKQTDSVPDHIWWPLSLNENQYFIYSYHYNNYTLCTLVNCRELLEFVYKASAHNSMFLLLDSQGQCIYAPESAEPLVDALSESYSKKETSVRLDGTTYSLQAFTSNYGFRILAATERPGFFSVLAESLFPLAFPIYSLVMMPLLYYFLKRHFVAPVNYVLFGFSRIASGDLSYRAKENMFSLEFSALNRSFNAMVNQIKDLRLESYEEKIRSQRAESRYLRTISYPHFLLNNLNLINNFAYQKNEEGIHEAVLNLSTYLRYFVTSSRLKHTLLNDVQSARCYLNLNQLAYPNLITYTINYDEDLLDLRFPPLIISTIVENAIKHGLVPGQNLDIQLSLTRGMWRGKESLLITQSNNGPLFPEAILNTINSPVLLEQQTEHVGLASIKQSLLRNYNDSSEFCIENKADGAGISVHIRVHMDAVLALQKEITNIIRNGEESL